MTNKLESIIGFIILVIAISFLVFTYKMTEMHNVGHTYSVTAKFDQIDGVVIGSDVKISGVKIGEVTSIYLDSQQYNAVVTIAIDDSIKLPMDSSIKIVGSSLFGNKHLAIDIGASEEMLPAGGEIAHTQSAINLESLLGKLMFTTGSDKKS
jgi:phospholipid/cholesterol/gamma-HCH transport system substrate-binding protein